MSKNGMDVKAEAISAPKSHSAPYKRINTVFPILVEPGQTWADLSLERRKAEMLKHENLWKSRYSQGSVSVGVTNMSWTRG